MIVTVERILVSRNNDHSHHSSLFDNNCTINSFKNNPINFSGNFFSILILFAKRIQRRLAMKKFKVDIKDVDYDILGYPKLNCHFLIGRVPRLD